MVADGDAVAVQRVPPPTPQRGLAGRHRRAAQAHRAQARHGAQRRQPVGGREPQAAEALAQRQAALEVAVDVERAGDPGAPEPELVGLAQRVGQRDRVAHDQRELVVGSRGRRDLGTVPEPQAEVAGAGGAAVDAFHHGPDGFGDAGHAWTVSRRKGRHMSTKADYTEDE